MKEYLRSDGDTLTISYTADETTTDIIFNVYDLDLKDYIQADEAVSVADNVFNIILSQEVCKYDRNLKIELQVIHTNQYVEDELYINLVRPYATVEEIAEELGFTITNNPDSDKEYTRAQIEKLERKARLFIDSKINDTFNFEYKTIGTYGMNTDLLHLGNRIESFDQIIFDDYIVYDSTADPEIDELGRTISLSGSKYGLKVVAEGVNIAEWVDVNPLSFPGYWNKDSAYLVRGEFGWRYVPEPIKEATIELVNDMTCSDFIYRTRGIKSLKTDAYDIQFADSIINGSGNVLVDALIAPYKRFEIKAI
jgi:hypothetical protein